MSLGNRRNTFLKDSKELNETWLSLNTYQELSLLYVSKSASEEASIEVMGSRAYV